MTPWTVAFQAPLPMGFSRQEYWSGLPFPSPGDLPAPGIEPRSPTLQVDSLLNELCGKKTNVMASDSITPWQISGETMGGVTNFIFLGFKITADGDCSHEIKTFAPWKKSYDIPRQLIKIRDITLPQQRYIIKAMVFPGVIYGYENWTVKKADH